MSTLTKITTHAPDAQARLPEQYRDKPKLLALIAAVGAQSQVLEDVLYDLLQNGSLSTASGAALDQLGDIVGQDRGGRTDDKYKIRILAKIGQNISRGTGEDLIQIFKALMQADLVYLNPNYPAGASLTAIGSDPIGTIDEIRAAMEQSHAGGVSIDYYFTTPAVAFSFADDPDPAGQGFGDFNDATVGGTFATIL